MKKTQASGRRRAPRARAEAADIEHRRARIIAGEIASGDVTALRRLIGLTQERFAEALGISVRTLQNWEQDRTAPQGPSLALLRIAAREPRVIRG